MAPLPESNTPRAFVKYHVQGHDHTLMVRCQPDASDADVSTEIGAFLTAAADLVGLSTFVSFERSEEGSNVRVPADWSGPADWGTGGTGDDDQNPLFWSFTGKSLDGRRFRVDLFGRDEANNTNWRVLDTESAAVSDALDAIRTAESCFVTISGLVPFVNGYANQSTSQHWIKEARK